MSRPWLVRLGPLAGAGALLLLAHVPQAARALPILDVLRGPLGYVLGVLALGAAVAAGGGDRLGPHLRRPVPAVLLFVAGVILLGRIGYHYTGGIQVSGDEPHYLLMAQSLWRDGDLELRDNKMRGEMEEYVPGDVAIHWGAPRADGRPFPAHSVGLPAMLAPVYALGGRRACVLFLAALGSLLALVARALAWRATHDEGAALLAWVATLGPPAAFYSFHVYTELPSALALGGAALLLWRSSRSVPGAVAAALLASALPWLHMKLIPAAAALGIIAVLRLEGRPRVAFVSIAALAAAGYLGFFYSVFEKPTPLAVYGGVPRGLKGFPLRASFGLWIDRSYGLLPYAPVFLLSLAAVPLVVRRSWRELWPGALVAAAVLGPVVTWRMWWGGQCPPGRFLLPLVPLLAVLLAVRASRDAGPPRGLLRWRAALVAAGYALLVYGVLEPARMLLLGRRNRPSRMWEALSGEGDLNRYLPSLSHGPDEASVRVAVLWVVALAVVLLLDALSRSRSWADRAFAGLALPLALFVLLGAGVDYWARRGDQGAASAQPSATFQPSTRTAGETEPRAEAAYVAPSSRLSPGARVTSLSSQRTGRISSPPSPFRTLARTKKATPSERFSRVTRARPSSPEVAKRAVALTSAGPSELRAVMSAYRSTGV
jgi:hypothetical protein